MKCPNCNSEDIDQTNKFDLANIDADEAALDFECSECECLFQIVYHAYRTKIVELATVEEIVQ